VTYARSSSGNRCSLLERRASIFLRTDGGIRLAVIADTHSRPHPNSFRLVEAARPDAILHAGDIGDTSVLEQFRELAPVFAVRGNIDGRGPELPDLLELDLTTREATEARETRGFKILLVHIGVNGPRLRADAARWAKQRGAELVVCGHSHVPFIGRDRGFGIFNPGSIGPRRFSLPIVFGICELSAGKLQMWHVDCESGDRWLPP
jgi:putative phosphoesterase